MIAHICNPNTREAEACLKKQAKEGGWKNHMINWRNTEKYLSTQQNRSCILQQGWKLVLAREGSLRLNILYSKCLRPETFLILEFSGFCIVHHRLYRLSIPSLDSNLKHSKGWRCSSAGEYLPACTSLWFWSLAQYKKRKAVTKQSEIWKILSTQKRFSDQACPAYISIGWYTEGHSI